VLCKTNYADFGREVFPAAVRSRNVQMHIFDDYWEDIGTIRSFYEANLSLASDHPPLLLSAAESPVFSRPRFLPPTRIGDARVVNSLIADGCRIGHGVTIENSVIGLRCMIEANVTIKNSVIMGADYYEDGTGNSPRGDWLPLAIGKNAYIDGAIIDKNCRIGAGARVCNEQGIEDGESIDGICIIRDRIPVVVKGSSLRENWRIVMAASSERNA
jgi:glucose-1-phosphate adenylyltransferase